MSVIEMTGAEWAWDRFQLDRRHRDDGSPTGDAPRPQFDEDALIGRYRNFETVISRFRPTTLREIAITALVTAEHTHIVETEYEANAVLRECGRTASVIRDALCAQVNLDRGSLQAELLSRSNDDPMQGPTLIGGLLAELAAAWDAQAALDRSMIAAENGHASENMQKALDANAETIDDLELAIASARIQSSSDFAIVLAMFAHDLQEDWSGSAHDRIQRDRRFKLWRGSISEYASRSGADCSHEVLRHYRNSQPEAHSIRLIQGAAE